MLLEEVFMTLFKNGQIDTFFCTKDVVKEAFKQQHNQQKIRRYSFPKFLKDMKKLNLVKNITEDEVFFNKELIEKLKEQETAEDITNALNKLSIEVNWSGIVNEHCCNLCLKKFTSEESYKNHEVRLSHQIRVMYSKDKSFPNNSMDLALTMYDPKTNDTLTEIKGETSKEFKVTGLITNNSETKHQVTSIVTINPRIIDVTMKIGKFKELSQGESIPIHLTGFFANSAQFPFSFVVVSNALNSTDQFTLVEIPIEIKSEFSYLQSNETFVPKEKKKIAIEVVEPDKVIPGEQPDQYKSNLILKLPLLKNDIPKSLETALLLHVKENPDFIKKNASLALNCLKSAKILKLPTILTQKNYVFLLYHLLQIEEFQMKVDIRDYDTFSTLKHVRSNIYELQVPGLAEARPSLVRYDSVYVKENKNDKCKYQGIVHNTREQSVILGFNSRFSAIYISNKQFHIEFGFSRRPVKVEKQALEIAADDAIIPYFYPKEVPTIKHNKIGQFFNTKLNDQQRSAIQNLVEIKEAPYLIFGPPGTGKTVTVVEAVLQIIKLQPEAKVLVCAPSNAAVNELSVRLLDKVPNKDIFRFLGPMYCCGDRSLPQIQKISNLGSDGSFYMPSIGELLGYRVILSTLVTAARLVNGGTPCGHFSYVFIDESGYATETECLIPVAGILSDYEDKNKGKVFGQLVLAGDPRQLGPILHSNFVKFCGLGRSMLERLIDTCEIYSRNLENEVPYNPRYVTKLISNYRSHRTILEVSNQLFYHGELVPEGNELTNVFLKWEHLKNEEFPVIFHNVHGDDRREKKSPSFYNLQEIEEVMSYLSKIIGTRASGIEINQEHIGVITPYRRQSEKIQQACAKKNWSKILVGSVEQFQGREKLVVIVSTVRSQNVDKFENIDKKFHLGFVRNAKRFNVALTRAKGLLIVIGNADVLKIDKNWRTFIKYCVDNKSIGGKPFALTDEDNYATDDTDEFDDDDYVFVEETPDLVDFSRGIL